MSETAGAAGPLASLPGRMLAAPALAWQELRARQSWWPAILWQYLLGALAVLLTFGPLQDLSQAGGAAGMEQLSAPVLLLLQLILLAFALLAANLFFTGLLALHLLLLGRRPRFIECWVWAGYSALPFMLGTALDALTFMLVGPLAREPGAILALRIRPFSFGLATFLPSLFPPLSLPWVLFSYLDLFGIWSVATLLVGARRFLGFSRSETGWLALAVVLSLGLVLTGLWQIIQRVETVLGS